MKYSTRLLCVLMPAEHITRNLFLLLLTFTIPFASCTKSGGNSLSDNNSGTGKIAAGPGIYIAGSETTTNSAGQIFVVAKMWKDGIPVVFTDSTHDAALSSVYVTATDVYAVGYEYKDDQQTPVAKLWKNGKATALANTASKATGVFVSGSDVYISGYMQTGNLQSAVVWKNGVARTMGATANPDVANSVYVFNSEVYATGTDNYAGKVWVETAGSFLSNSSTRANFITVSGTDVYIAGQVNFTGLYTGYGGMAEVWKNGTGTSLTANGSNSVANALYVNGKDIHVVGSGKGQAGDANDVAIYWKNGVATKLSSHESSANAITLLGTDVYILGEDSKGFNPGVKGIVTLWKNGVAVAYTDGTNDAHGSSLFIVQ